MKKELISYLFYTIYLLALIKPMYPVLDYMVNYNYIATQLCENINKPVLDCNGKCYVVNKIENTQNQSEHSLIPKVEFEKYTFKNLTLTLTTNSEIITFNRKTNFYYLEKNSEPFLDSIFQPPIV